MLLKRRRGRHFRGRGALFAASRSRATISLSALAHVPKSTVIAVVPVIDPSPSPRSSLIRPSLTIVVVPLATTSSVNRTSSARAIRLANPTGTRVDVVVPEVVVVAVVVAVDIQTDVFGILRLFAFPPSRSFPPSPPRVALCRAASRWIHDDDDGCDAMGPIGWGRGGANACIV